MEGRVQRLVREEEEHPRREEEQADVPRNGLHQRNGDRKVEQEHEHDRVGRHQDEPELTPASKLHVVVREDHVMMELVANVERAEARRSMMEHPLVHSPLETETDEERDRDREEL